MNREALANVCANFRILGDFVEAHPYGNGHINDTYAVSVDQAGRPLRYILQRINSHAKRNQVGNLLPKRKILTCQNICGRSTDGQQA